MRKSSFTFRRTASAKAFFKVLNNNSMPSEHEFRFPSAKPAPLSIKKQLAAQRYLLGLLDLMPLVDERSEEHEQTYIIRYNE